MTNAKVKVAYDITPTLRAAYTFGFWKNDADAERRHVSPRTSGNRRTRRRPDSRAASTTCDSSTRRTASRCAPTRAATGISSSSARVSHSTRTSSARRRCVVDGHRFAHGRTCRGARRHRLVQPLDAKAAWHRGGPARTHTLSFGAHAEHYTLAQPDVQHAGLAQRRRARPWSPRATERQRRRRSGLRTRGAWRPSAQAHRSADDMKAGAASTATTSTAPRRSCSRPSARPKFSPKAVARVDADSRNGPHGSVGKAYRFATAAELYQLVTTGTTFTSPNPNLKPDNVLAPRCASSRTFDAWHACRSRCSRTTCTTRSSRSSCRSCPIRRRCSRTSRTSTTSARAASSCCSARTTCPCAVSSFGQRHLRRRARRSRCRAARARRRRQEARSASSCRTFRSGGEPSSSTYRPDRARWPSTSRPVQQQDVHDARQRRRALQHVSGLCRVVRDGRARELPVQPQLVGRRSASTICSIASISSSIRSHSARSWAARSSRCEMRPRSQQRSAKDDERDAEVDHQPRHIDQRRNERS